ncbi:hypothetical protein DS832_09070 [Bombilactobacillus bombi]|uniref:Uncharacterized protein n=1 Tax=Bombilactobacillus bombi TaxID=1303590 RepID=A0A417Z1D5_9LACO|nr:hypothetical protein [Bombilactobacillus bombi]RHW44374.1 hypothetical protein DS832_09070 [Bombilactobacillus bombi]
MYKKKLIFSASFFVTYAQIRKNLAGIATKDVINKVAPVDVKNEKYDSKIPQSKIEIKDVESYIDVSTLTEKGAKVYAIAHYTIDDSPMTTRINLNLQNQHNKLEVIDANYDVVKSNNN